MKIRKLVASLPIAGAMVAASSVPARADFIITPIVSSIFLAVGGPAAVAAVAFGSTTWVSLVSGIVTIAAGIGLSMLLTPKPPKPEDGRISTQQPIPPRSYGYGRARFAGFVVFKEVKTKALYQINVLTGHPIIGFVAWYLHDDVVELDSSGVVNNDTDGRYKGYVTLIGRTGDVPETAYPLVVNAFSDIWTAFHRGDGCASLMIRCGHTKAKWYSKRYPYGPPEPAPVMDLARVFDPRDETQVWNDETTWSDSGYENPILQLLHFECFSLFGPRRDYEVAVLPVIDRWIAEADICDELVALKSGGTEKRYRCGFITDTSKSDVRATRKMILDSCDGWFVERGDGAIIVVVGKYREPTVTIGDDDISAWSWQNALANGDRYESMTAKWTSPDNAYVSVDTDPVVLDNGDLAPDQARVGSFDITMVQSVGQASRLLRRECSRYAEARRGIIETRLSGLAACYERWVYIGGSKAPGLSQTVIENRGPKISLSKGKCVFEFLSSGPHIDTYDAATMESASPLVVTRPNDDELPVPSGVTPVATVYTASDGTTTVIITVTFDAYINDDGEYEDEYSYDLRWRIVGDDTWLNSVFQDYDINSGTITLKTGVVVADQTYEVSVATVDGGDYSTWSTPIEVSTALTYAAPAPPSFTATGGTGTISWSVTAPNSPNVYAVRLWRDVSGGSFASATDISGLIYCSANQVVTYEETSVSSGSYDLFATSENSSGVASSAIGPATVTVS